MEDQAKQFKTKLKALVAEAVKENRQLRPEDVAEYFVGFDFTPAKLEEICEFLKQSGKLYAMTCKMGNATCASSAEDWGKPCNIR